jgi:hypothetical protein
VACSLGRSANAAAFDTRLGSALAGGAGYGIVYKLQGHGYGLVKNPEGFRAHTRRRS